GSIPKTLKIRVLASAEGTPGRPVLNNNRLARVIPSRQLPAIHQRQGRYLHDVALGRRGLRHPCHEQTCNQARKGKPDSTSETPHTLLSAGVDAVIVDR